MTREPSDPTPFVLLVGPETNQLAKLLHGHSDATRRWLLATARDAGEALGLFQGGQLAPPDMIVLHADDGDRAVHALFEHAKASWPRTFFVLAAEQPSGGVHPLLYRHGDMPVEHPESALLCAAIEQQVASLSLGSLRGLSLTSLLQMLEWEAKSLAVRVQSGARWGRLHLYRGQLVDAYVHEGAPTGETAAYDILSWSNVSISLERSYRNLHRVIEQPLTSLLMEAMRRKDETAASFGIDDLLLDDAGTGDEAAPDLAAAQPAMPQAEPGAAGRTEGRGQAAVAVNIQATLETARRSIEGALALALVDASSGMALGSAGEGLDMEVAASGKAAVVRAERRATEALGQPGELEDILSTLERQHHVLSLIPGTPLFLFLVLDREQANLALARYKLRSVAGELNI